MIRILHTSDWHLGLELGGHDRLWEQAQFLDWLLETCRKRSIDALLVAGDVYDSANPSLAAQKLFHGFLARFHQEMPGSQLVVVAGNHDSGARLELPRPFGLALGDIHLAGTLRSDDPGLLDKHLIRLTDRAQSPAAWVLAVPFLRAEALQCRITGEESVEQAYLQSVAALHETLRAQAQARDPELPVITMGHLTLAGSDRAGSERILIGGVESVPVSTLATGSDYVALGHIHRAQTVGSEHVRYSGSPLPIDFDERSYRHQVCVVELDGPGQPVRIESVAIPRPVPFLRFGEPPCPWSELEGLVEAYDWTPWQELPREQHPFVDLQILADSPVPDLRERCERLCQGKPFRLVGSPRMPRPRSEAEAPVAIESDLSSSAAPLELLRHHWRRTWQTEPEPAVEDCFREILDQLHMERKSP